MTPARADVEAIRLITNARLLSYNEVDALLGYIDALTAEHDRLRAALLALAEQWDVDAAAAGKSRHHGTNMNGCMQACAAELRRVIDPP